MMSLSQKYCGLGWDGAGGGSGAEFSMLLVDAALGRPARLTTQRV